ELAALAAADELAHGALEAAERYLGLAERGMASVPDARRAHAQLLLGITRLVLARQRWNLQAVTEGARQLRALAEAPEAAQPRLGEELRALALISLGTTEFWAAGEDPERHLEMGVALASRIGGRFLSSLAWPTRRQLGSTSRSPGLPSAGGKRPSWPGAMAGPRSRLRASPT